MRSKVGLAVLLLSVLFWAPGGPAAQLAGSRLQPVSEPLLHPASLTVPPEAPVVVENSAAVNDRGWAGSAATAATGDLTDDVLAAYTLAVAISPSECHITTPLLAAIGQVESGNLAGHSLDARHRVSPEILGPVLDGKTYRAIADTDGGQWDGDKVWDRALGPMQIIPATWRVVGLDMDGDGLRDPQNVYDAAGAAMVYLCAGGRDLSTSDGLREAILSYNSSEAYLRAVLAWKSVFDEADLTGMGAVPFVAALGVPLSTPLPVGPSPATRTNPTGTTATTAADPVSPSAPGTPAASPSAAPQQPGSAVPAPSASAVPRPSSPGISGPATPGTGTPGATPPASEEPKPDAKPDPKPAADPVPLPECPVPTPEPTPEPTTGPGADATADELVVSPETCTPPEGYAFDPETGELVAVPEASPAP